MYMYMYICCTCKHNTSIFPLHLTWQRRQLEILLSGFSERSEFIGLLVNDELLHAELDEEVMMKWAGSRHIKTVFALCDRIVHYIRTATVSELNNSF